MTLAKVVIDTCQATFAVGILYTALTSVRSLHDIIIDDFEESYLTTRLSSSAVISLRKEKDLRLYQLHKATARAHRQDVMQMNAMDVDDSD